jgi:hypothetical protein
MHRILTPFDVLEVYVVIPWVRIEGLDRSVMNVKV